MNISPEERNIAQLCKILSISFNYLHIGTQNVVKFVRSGIDTLLQCKELPVAFVKVLTKCGKSYESDSDVLFNLCNYCSIILTKISDIDEETIKSIIDFQV